MKNVNTNKAELQPTLGILLYSYNNQEDIEECIQSAKQATETITVIDFESTDNTRKLAQEEGVAVITHPFISYVEPARNFGMQKAQTDWIFILDADERITPELAKEMQRAISSPQYSYYKVPRKELFGKKTWLRHGGWWPNYQLRLIKKDAFVQWPKAIHSTPEIHGQEGRLDNALLHYSQNDWGDIVNKTTRFEDIESTLLFEANKPVGILTFFRKFAGELYRRLLKWQGYKDGDIGIIESIYQAFSKTITYLYLYEKKNRRSV